MSTPPPPPPPPPGGAPPLPPTAYPGTGFQGFDAPSVDEYTYGSTPPGRLPRASWVRRLGAYLIDGLLLSVPFVLGVIALVAGPTEISTCTVTADGDVAVFGEEGVATALCEGPTAVSWAMFGLFVLVAIGGFFVLSAHEGRRGVTPGKKALGLRTVDRNTAEPIGTARGIGRNVVRAVGEVIPFAWFLDHLWPLWDEHAQALHDKAVSAQVIDVSDPATWGGVR